MNAKNLYSIIIFLISLMFISTPLLADESGMLNKAREDFINAFNDRNWEAVKDMFADEALFHRGNGDTLYKGKGDVADRLKDPIGDQWNVRFTRLENTQFTAGNANDPRTVDTGHFAITAGDDSSACYAGTYQLTWNNDAKILYLGWQDVESEMNACQ